MINTSRNVGILTLSEQEKVSHARVAILGLGMGSVVAELLVRMGISDFLLVDGDTVSDTNLNRQAFNAGDVGEKKAASLKNHLLKINSGLQINSVERFLAPDENLDELLGDRDVIVDTIDLSALEVILNVHNWAKNKGVPVIFPINLGWKSMATVFTRESADLTQLLRISSSDQAKLKDFSFWAEFLAQFVPQYGIERFKEFIAKAQSMNDWCPAPQWGITIHTTASLVGALVVKLVLGEKTVLAPEVSSIDLYYASENK